MGITPQDFEKMKGRVAPRAVRRPSPLQEPSGIAPRPAPAGIVLGIDPSLRGTGFGVVRLERAGPVAVAHGTVRCPDAWARSRCLARIHEAIRDVVREHRPVVCAVEGLFFAQNLQTAMIMGEARGAALAAVAAAGIDIFEIAPRKVKLAVVGYGAAQKSAVAKMVQRALKLAEPPAPDAADALALALAWMQDQGRHGLGQPRRV